MADHVFQTNIITNGNININNINMYTDPDELDTDIASIHAESQRSKYYTYVPS